MIKIFISIAYALCRNFYAGILKIFNINKPGTFVVLFYHGIPAHHRARFAAHMDALIKRARPVRSDFNGPLESGVHYAAVTFDDAFQSVADNALPELEKRNIPCTVFVPTAHCGKQPGWLGSVYAEACSETVMSFEQIEKLVEHPLVSLHSHCHTHPRLADLSDAAAEFELKRSKEILEGMLGKKVTQIAFPFGSFNERTQELAAQAGYERAFGILPTMRPFTQGDFFVGRVDACADDMLVDIELKIKGAYQWLPRAVMIKSQVRSVLKAVTGRNRR